MSSKTFDSEEKILIAAKKVFAESGFGEARIDEIAKSAKVNKAMIYYHFQSKENLYLSVIRSFFESDKLFKTESDFQNIKFWDILTQTIKLFSENVKKSSNEKSMLICREMVSRGPIFQMMRDKYWIPSYEHIKFLIEKGIESGEFQTDQNPYFITFSIISHLVFYNINEVTYRDSSIYTSLYPDNYSEKMECYLFDFLKKILNLKSEN